MHATEELIRTAVSPDEPGADEADHSLYEWVAQSGHRPVEVVAARGCTFTTAGGRQVLDFASQLVVTNLGHSLRPIHEAVLRHSANLSYVSPSMSSPMRRELSRRLAEVFGDPVRSFVFSSSGSEANNDALRIARTVTGRSRVLYSARSYHGSIGMAAMSSGDPRRALMEQEPTVCVPFPARTGDAQRDLAAFAATLELTGPETVAAVILESVTGGNGVLVPADGYLPGIAELCRRNGILLICDEVLTGFGRTGRWFAYQHWGLTPDIVTVGKALSAGVAPIAAAALTPHVAAHFADRPLGCGHTFSAPPLACAAACAALRLYDEWGAVENAATLGGELLARLTAIADENPGVVAVRALGLLAAIELDRPAAPVQQELLRRDVYTIAKGACLILAPPLVIGVSALQRGLDVIAATLRDGAPTP